MKTNSTIKKCFSILIITVLTAVLAASPVAPETTAVSAPQTSDFSAMILALGSAGSVLGVCLSGQKKSLR